MFRLRHESVTFGEIVVEFIIEFILEFILEATVEVILEATVEVILEFALEFILEIIVEVTAEVIVKVIVEVTGDIGRAYYVVDRVLFLGEKLKKSCRGQKKAVHVATLQSGSTQFLSCVHQLRSHS